MQALIYLIDTNKVKSTQLDLTNQWISTTKKDLTGLGLFAYMGFIGLFVACLLNLFLRSAALDFAVSFIGVGIFTILTAWDTQKLKSIYYAMSGNTYDYER